MFNLDVEKIIDLNESFRHSALTFHEKLNLMRFFLIFHGKRLPITRHMSVGVISVYRSKKRIRLGDYNSTLVFYEDAIVDAALKTS